MFGAVLRKAREKAGMTQEGLAFEADLDRIYVSRLEHDRMSPTVNTLLRLGILASRLVSRVERLAK
jgi:transcriptional regulator with XRE-family HTH domain